MAVSRELPGAQPVIATVREDVVVVLVEHEDRELVVILDRETDWRVPHMLTGSQPASVTRPQQTSAVEPLLCMSVGQSGVGTAEEPPTEAWQAITGVAAWDAESLTAKSEVDEHVASVRLDGRVVAVVRNGWRAEPEVHLKTREGNLFRVWL